MTNLFYSYAQKDEELQHELEKHLSILKRQGKINEFHGYMIQPGLNRKDEINRHLLEASIILLLISADYIASDYCYSSEMYSAIERIEKGVRIVPIILRSTNYEGAPFDGLQTLPSKGKSVASWDDKDEAFSDISKGISSILNEQKKKQKQRHLLTNTGATNLSHKNYKYRSILLRKIRGTWINDMLGHSLHDKVLIELNLQEQPDALANPWRYQVQEIGQNPRLLPPNTMIKEIYKEAGQELLILGNPGAGKTTQILILTRELLEEAEENEYYPIPLLLNLSSWSTKRKALSTWMIQELKEKYDIPSKVGKEWIDNEHIVLLLDGLDEVNQFNIERCVSAINGFRKENHLPIVICSRSEEYFKQNNRLELHTAVTIQPLTTQQIDDYLLKVGDKLGELRKALIQGSKIKQLATTPLWLSILTLIYKKGGNKELTTIGSSEEQVFEIYFNTMLNRRTGRSQYKPEEIKRWLAWIAKQMKLRNLTTFYLDDLTPEWLPATWYNTYFGTNLFAGLAMGGIAGFKVGRKLTSRAPGIVKWVVIPVSTLIGITSGGVGGSTLGTLPNPKKRPVEEEKNSEGPQVSSPKTPRIALPIGKLIELLMWRADVAPRHYSRFLDYSVERILLLEFGDGYKFIHPLFLEYFDSLDLTLPESAINPKTKDNNNEPQDEENKEDNSK